MAQLQEWEADDRRSDRDRELLLAAEAQHRLSILRGDSTRLEDLAGEWIDLLRASSGKTVS
jgi:hypothetical protein